MKKLLTIDNCVDCPKSSARDEIGLFCYALRKYVCASWPYDIHDKAELREIMAEYLAECDEERG